MKTITVTDDAYESMKRAKKNGESFSDLAIRTYGKKITAKDLLGILKGGDIEEGRKRLKEIHERLGKDMEEKLRALRSR